MFRRKKLMKGKDKKLTGVREIARRAGVSIGTVDRVLHNRPGVSVNTRNKTNQIIKEINYRPNLLARRLASNKTTHFVTLIPKVSEETSFWELPLKGIQKAESEIKQYNVEVEKYFFDQNDRSSFVKEFNKILKKKVDGILMAPHFFEEAINFTNKCQSLNIPYVFMNSDLPGQPSLSYIGPHAYESGYVAANLTNYLITPNDRVLMVHISTEIENQQHFLRKEEGFRKYFNDYKIPVKIEKVDICKVSYDAVKNSMDLILRRYLDIKVIYVTNSKVSIVARYLKEHNKNILLIGYDLLKESIEYLEQEIINFLICQKPGEQAYRGMMALYRFIVLKLPVEQYNYMPKDIIMKTNYSNHSDFSY